MSLNKSDSSDISIDDINTGNKFYKTNTRTVTIFGKITIDLNTSTRGLNLQVKFSEVDTYLLWTKDYSPKWSNDVLLDNERTINTMMNNLLSKMGFVNILKVSALEISLTREKLTMNPKTNKPIKELKSFASLPDMTQSESVELPRMCMNTESNTL